MTAPDNKHPNILFLSIPQSLCSQIAKLSHNERFSINPDIPIPIEIPPDEEKPNLENLTLEMIISGMLRVIAEDSTEWIEYYRHFVLAVRPGIMEELTYAAAIKARDGDVNLALEIFDILTGLFPDSAELPHIRRQILEGRENLTEYASPIADEYFNTARELIRQGKEKAALEPIRCFIEIQPTVWNGWFVLGWALRRLNRWKDGEAAFSKAIELGGSGSDIRNERAICLMELGDFQAARRELETALRSDPENVKIISNLGVLAQKAGNKTEAEAFFRTVLELDPEDAIANEWLAASG